MHAHDGYKPHSHEVRADHRGVERVAQISDRHALDRIAAVLSGQEWCADTCDAIAAIVRDTGREVRDWLTRAGGTSREDTLDAQDADAAWAEPGEPIPLAELEDGLNRGQADED